MIVPGHGPPNARIAIIGEAPGASEESQGLPFVGASGQLLTQMLTAAGIDRSQCYLTNVIKQRPPNNDFGLYYEDPKTKHKPTPALLAAQAALRDELSRLRPNVCCPVGDEALRAITGKRGIGSWRGSILQSPVGKCVPTYHPAYVLRMYDARPVAELDFKRVLAESASPDIKLSEYRFEIQPSFTRVCEYLREPRTRIAFDIETTGNMVRCLGLSDRLGHALCIPFISQPSNYRPSGAGGSQITQTLFFIDTAAQPEFMSHWTEEEEYEIASLLDKLFSDPSIEKVAQNFPFDSVILAREYGFTFRNLVLDTMLAQHTCYCELPKGLDFLTSIYTRWPYYSDYDAHNDHQTWTYNCWDAMVTFEIAPKLERELESLRVSKYYRHFKHNPMLAFTRAETRGIAVDLVERERRTTESEQRLGFLTERLRASTGIPKLNPSSDKQIKDYVYTILRLPLQFHRKTKQPTMDKDARRKLREKYPQHREFFEQLDEYSQLDTLLSSFLKKPLGSDGRMRTHYNPAGTTSDRLSSSEPLFDLGTNLQNIPRGEFRRMFVSDPGWSLIKADLSQAENRIVVWDAPVPRLIELYQQGDFDVHRWFASLIYKVSEELVQKQQRDTAKNGIYGGNYKMFYVTAAATYKMSLQDAKFVLEAHRRTIPEIPLWWNKIESQINQTRILENPLGRRRIFFGRLDDETYRQAYADKPQSTVAGLINRAFALSDDMFDDTECYPLLQVHDEIVYHCRDDRVEYYLPIIKNLLEYPLHFSSTHTPLIIPADIAVGKNWHDMKKVEFKEKAT